jgi:hypothetical protein
MKTRAVQTLLLCHSKNTFCFGETIQSDVGAGQIAICKRLPIGFPTSWTVTMCG